MAKFAKLHAGMVKRTVAKPTMIWTVNSHGVMELRPAFHISEEAA
jgi:hypothetical protein